MVHVIVDVTCPNNKAAQAALKEVSDLAAQAGIIDREKTKSEDLVPSMAKALLKAGFMPAMFDKTTPSEKLNRAVIKKAVEAGFFRDETRTEQLRAYLLPKEARGVKTHPENYALHRAAYKVVDTTTTRVIAALTTAYDKKQYDDASPEDKAALDVIDGLEKLAKKEAAKPLPRLKKALASFVEAVDGVEGFETEQTLLTAVLHLAKIVAHVEAAPRTKDVTPSKGKALELAPEDFEEVEEMV